jgi:superfamily II DNA helicase RecQ
MDIFRRAKEFNIPCSIYEENNIFTNLTLISIKSIISSNFISLVKDLINNNKLDKIIFDECHLLITSSSYRSIMFQVKNLLLFNIQLIFLTETLPISFEQELINSLYLNEIVIIRAPCFKYNISYRVQNYISYKEEDKIQEIQNYIINFKGNEFITKNDKVIIFCSSKNEVELMSDFLNCCKYYFELSDEEK